jgi:DNA-directed RNA polymerase subunit M/transcription elongation factor TFIIS
MLRKVRQTQKDKCHMFSCIYGISIKKIKDMKVEEGLFGKRKGINERKATREDTRMDEHDQDTLNTCMKCHNETHYFVQLKIK